MDLSSLTTAPVSIHAPAWGATHIQKFWKQTVWFQSTLPRGERQTPRTCSSSSCRFQSTLPRGERPYKSGPVHLIKRVSIHAPAWGATGPASPMTPPLAFQSTLPRGERLPGFSLLLPALCFNPRSRVGSDCLGRSDQPVPGVSIHAPAWGATVAQILSFKTRCSLLLSGNMAFTERNRASVRVVCGCIFN